MSGDDVNSREINAREILSYFLRNPEAVDSFDGIARWRLLEDIARRSVAATESGLNWLIEQGYLKQQLVPGGRRVFSLNGSMREKAEQFVSGRQDEPKRRNQPSQTRG